MKDLVEKFETQHGFIIKPDTTLTETSSKSGFGPGSEAEEDDADLVATAGSTVTLSDGTDPGSGSDDTIDPARRQLCTSVPFTPTPSAKFGFTYPDCFSGKGWSVSSEIYDCCKAKWLEVAPNLYHKDLRECGCEVLVEKGKQWASQQCWGPTYEDYSEYKDNCEPTHLDHGLYHWEDYNFLFE